MAKKPKARPKAKAVAPKKKPAMRAKPAKPVGSKQRVTSPKAKSHKRAFLKSKAAKPVMARVLTGTTNLLVTYDPNHKGIAEAELKEAFSRIGERYELVHTDVEGLFKLKTQDARRVVRKLSDVCRREAQALSTTHRYTPIDAWCKSEPPVMQKTIKGLVSNIGHNERWKMAINKRHWDKMHSTELIVKLTDVIDRPKVDLEHPEKIIQVEIIGKEAGISLLRPDETLDVMLAKG